MPRRVVHTTPRMSTHRALDALYATLPRLQCAGKCQESCGPIGMTSVEWERLTAATLHAWTLEQDLACPMLDRDSGQCRVYLVRPMICRLWGVVETMPCPWGCIPERWLTYEEGQVFLRAAETAAMAEEAPHA